MRFTIFSWHHIASKFKKLITNGPAFRFDMDDIARIRNEMGTLINRLEKKYRVVKDEEKREKQRSKKTAKSEEPPLDAEVSANFEKPAADVDDDLQNTDSENESDAPLPKATTGYIETPQIDTVDQMDMDTSDGERELKDSQNTVERAVAAVDDADETMDTPDSDAMMVDVPDKPEEGETDEGDSEVLLDSDDEDLPEGPSAPTAKPSSPGSDTEATGRSENSMCLDTSPAASSAKGTEASNETEVLDDFLISSQTPPSQSSRAPKAVAPTEKENHPNLDSRDDPSPHSGNEVDIENQSDHWSGMTLGGESADV